MWSTPFSDRVKIGETPKRFCPRHGVEMRAKPETQFDVMTGKEKVVSFIMECPRFFCWQGMVIGIIGPRPDYGGRGVPPGADSWDVADIPMTHPEHAELD